ncbi:hypothetical protein FHS55_001496 [Angulomicrobium tetraedrale]|uniref:DUF2125 domain-containing protein n=1 Tax=Ancylobacter tetraedralis TaxID=217068 RepID=A0A839Z773_9HYPH|nr:DUF2125 domain-containing protein [Ancylobacter tetraedralis]MBB3770901.1 hypothetical protein [Ancylobacter tetraedralis]
MSPPAAPTEPTPPSPAAGEPRRARRWLIALPVGLIILAALGWTGAWFYAASRATGEIDAWMAQEASKGRTWSCTDRQFGGFPFRFELICTAPTVTFAGEGVGKWEASATRAHAVAQVWNPGHIIAEFEAPGRLSDIGTGQDLTANWSLLQVSAVGTRARAERMSLSANDYVLSAGGTSLFAAKHAELHVRHTPNADDGTLDIAAGVKGASGATSGAGAPPLDGDIEATVTQVPEFRAMSPAERLRLWQAAGGRVNLLEARVSAGGGALAATGQIGLDALNRPDGKIDLQLANAPALMNALAANGLMPGFIASLAPVMMAVGMPGTLDGAPAASFPFVFRNGRVALGMLPLGKVGPLY